MSIYKEAANMKGNDAIKVYKIKIKQSFTHVCAGAVHGRGYPKLKSLFVFVKKIYV